LREDQKLSLITHRVSASADAAYFAGGKSLVQETLAVTVADDDVPGVLVQQSNGSTLVSNGVSDSYTVRPDQCTDRHRDDHAAQRRLTASRRAR
jgi:hypothetical protein